MVFIRPANQNDLLPVYRLANDPVVRTNGFSSTRITLKEHKTWFKKNLADKNAFLLIAKKGGQFVGQIRFNFAEENVIGVSISPDFRGQGLGVILIEKGLKYVKKMKPEIKKITAYIRVENIASIKTFEKSGFQFDRQLKVDGYKALKYTYDLEK